MNRKKSRLILAAVLSGFSLFLTMAYYFFTAPKDAGVGELLAIAFVKTVDGTHYSKRENSELWSSLQEGDPIFPSDTIKTGDAGEVKLQFLQGTATLDIESNSLVQITVRDANVVLDLLEGYMVTRNSESSAKRTSLFLKMDSEAKSLDDEFLSLARDSEKKLSIGYSPKLDIENEHGIRWSSPTSDFELELNPDDPKVFDFKWAGKKEGHVVGIEWGPSRKNFPNAVKATAGQELIQTTVPIGRHFWRWSIFAEGLNEPIWSSPSAKLVVKGKFPPPVVSPVGGSIVRLKDEAVQDLNFKWLASQRFEKYQVEVASDAKLEKKVAEETLVGRDSFVIKSAKFGVYYWRLSGYEPKAKEWIRTKIHSFKFLPKEIEKTQVSWVTKNDKPIKFLTMEPTVSLDWVAENESAVKQYRLRVAAVGEDLRNSEAIISKVSEFLVPLPRSGRFRAQVEALNHDQETMGQSSILIFEVVAVPRLRAPALAFETSIIQANVKGQAKISWAPVFGAKDYLIELKGSDGKVQTFYSKSSAYTLTKLMPGTYNARISAVDETARSGESSAVFKIVVPNKSAVRQIKVKKLEVN